MVAAGEIARSAALGPAIRRGHEGQLLKKQALNAKDARDAKENQRKECSGQIVG